jgi:hypothetical protein
MLGVMRPQSSGNAVSRGTADTCADGLNDYHQGEGQQQRPAQAEPELRSRLRVGGDSAGIVVGRAGNQPGPEHLPESRLARSCDG